MKCAIFLLFVAMWWSVEAGGNCKVVPITQWSGAPSRRVEPLPSPVNLVIIQHTVSSECNSDAQCESAAKGVREYHMKVMGFDDIGQSFLIGGNGKVYEGAGWSRVGAHTLKYNKKSIGIAFIGDFRVIACVVTPTTRTRTKTNTNETDPTIQSVLNVCLNYKWTPDQCHSTQDKLPSPQALQAVQDFIACGVENKHLTEDYNLVGHRQLSLTQSPGEELYKQIQTWPHWRDNVEQV